jgi:molybdate transport system substrate-binding protein
MYHGVVERVQGPAAFGDLFLSADTELPDRLSAAALGLDPPFLYARGVLVLWAPEGSPLDLEQGLQGLSNPSVKRIALANPKLAPYGAAAEAALRQSGLLESLRPKFIVGESLAQAAQFASSAADAGFIALGQARAPALAGKGRHAEVPEALHPPLRQAGLILAWAKDPAAARTFRDFLLGAEGQAILKRHGYREAR